MLRQRGPHTQDKTKHYSNHNANTPPASGHTPATTMSSAPDDPRRPLLAADHAASGPLSSADPPSTATEERQDENVSPSEMENLSRKSQWIVLAVASGTCAAFNGVFAKLTTTDLTTSFATGIANALGLGSGEKVVEVIVRGIFFLLNLLFNGIMWALFTKALARGTSTTQVSIVNTSSNFMITAVLGFIIFSESLPPLWWLGAAMLVAGNVIIGRREEEDGNKDGIEEAESGLPRSSGEEERDGLLGADVVELRDGLDADVDVDAEVKRQQARDQEDILQLDEE